MISNTHTKNIPSVITIVFLSTSFLVSTVFMYIGLVINVTLFLFVLLLKNKINLIKINLVIEDKHVLWLFYMFFFVSFSIVSFLNLFVSGVSYIKYYPSIFGRMANITICFVLFLHIVNEKNKEKISTKILLNAYVAGCSILLFFGIWQILNIIFYIPYPDFETRDQIHTMDVTGTLPFFTRRVTSIALEPAFLIPFLIDAIIILFYTTKKYYWIILFAIVLFFTLSLSGYVNIFLIILIMLFFAKKTIKTFFVKIFVLISSVFVLYLTQNVFIVVFQRLNPAELLLSGRLQNSILSIRHMFFEASVFNFLFGFGPRGMSYIRNFVFYTSGWRQGEMIGTTTHIIFVDFFVEHGIVGVLAIILLFCYLFALATKGYNKTGNRLGQVLCLNLIISSLYTADYASPRFTIIMILLLCLYKDGQNKKILEV